MSSCVIHQNNFHSCMQGSNSPPTPLEPCFFRGTRHFAATMQIHILRCHFPFIVWPWQFQCQHQHVLLEAPRSCLGNWNSRYSHLCCLVAITALLKVLAGLGTHWLFSCCVSQPPLVNVNQNNRLSSYKKHKEMCPSVSWEIGNPASPELPWTGSESPSLTWLPSFLAWGVLCFPHHHVVSPWRKECRKQGLLLRVCAVHDTAGSVLNWCLDSSGVTLLQ